MTNLGKYSEQALRYAYQSACYGVEEEDKVIERKTRYLDEYKLDVEKAHTRRSNLMDEKLELRATLISLGIDPDKAV